MAPKERPPHADHLLAALADRQHGVVARRQLLALGMGAGAVKARVRAARLLPLHRGVYAVGHRRLTREGRWMAAVLACGDRAVLSHRAAAALHDLLPSRITEVTIPRTAHGPKGIRIHRSRRLTSHDVTRHDGIPVTTVARTLVDLADVVDAKRHRRAVERAELLRLHAPAEPIPGRRGAGRLTAVLAAHGPDVPLTRSDAERAMRELCEDVDLPRPSINRIVEGLEVDFSWHGHRLIVEVDGYAFHATRTAFEVDRRREVHLAARGWQVLRVSASQLRDEPAEVATAVRAALSAGRDRAAG